MARIDAAVNMISAEFAAARGVEPKSKRRQALEADAVRIPAVPLEEEVVQHLLGGAAPIPPHPCRLCPKMYAREPFFHEHLRLTHGGEDVYRERCWFEARVDPRPPGVHCGPLEFDADGLPRADKHPKERALYEAYEWKTPEARAKAQQVCTAQNMRWRAGLLDSALRRAHTDGQPATIPWNGTGAGWGYEARDLYVGEAVLWTGGPESPRLPCIAATILRIDEARPRPILLECDERRGRRAWAALEEVHKERSCRQVACVFCARRNWDGLDRFVRRRLWDIRVQRGEEAEKEDVRCFYDPDTREGCGGLAAQKAIAAFLSPVRYHKAFPGSTCLAELLRSCVFVPWGKGAGVGGGYEPEPELREFELRGCAPLLLHRRRVPAEHAQQSARDAPSLGPVVVSCRECAAHLRPAQQEGRHRFPTISKHMLANANWGGMLHAVIRKMLPIELLLLAWRRPVRRHWYCGEAHGSMAALLGNSIIVPCASAVDNALRWDAGKVSLPHRDASLLSEYVQFALVGNVQVAEDCSPDRLREIIRGELRKHTLSRARRKEVGDCARLIAHYAPHGLVAVDEEAIAALPENDVPDVIVDLVRLQQPAGQAKDPLGEFAQAGPADASALGDVPMQKRVLDAGLGGMVQIPIGLGEADPVEAMQEAEKKLQKAFAAAGRGGEDEVAGEELQGRAAAVGDAMGEVQARADAERREAADRAAEYVKDGTLVLPTGQKLASLWDPMTWWFTFWALWPHQDLCPYLDLERRPISMTLRETFAYIHDREELQYPLAAEEHACVCLPCSMEGEAAPPLEPCRWRGARKNDFQAQECQVTMVGHIAREGQTTTGRAVANTPGFKKKFAALGRKLSSEELLQAAVLKAKTGGRKREMGAGVSANTRAALEYIELVTEKLKGTQAERELQRIQMTWQWFCHGAYNTFETPNVRSSFNPWLAILALGPGEGSLVDEPVVRPGTPLMRLSDLSTDAQKGYDVLVTFARDPYALCEMTAKLWEAWQTYAVGVGPVGRHRDGVASITAFPGQAGTLRSNNAPAETQTRGQMHVHEEDVSVVEVPTSKLMGMSLDDMEHYLRAALHFVQGTSFASCPAVARALGAAGDPADYAMPMDKRHARLAETTTQARRLLARQLAGEDVYPEVTRMVHGDRAARAAWAAAVAVGAVLWFDIDRLSRKDCSGSDFVYEQKRPADDGDDGYQLDGTEEVEKRCDQCGRVEGECICNKVTRFIPKGKRGQAPAPAAAAAADGGVDRPGGDAEWFDELAAGALGAAAQGPSGGSPAPPTAGEPPVASAAEGADPAPAQAAAAPPPPAFDPDDEEAWLSQGEGGEGEDGTAAFRAVSSPRRRSASRAANSGTPARPTASGAVGPPEIDLDEQAAWVTSPGRASAAQGPAGGGADASMAAPGAGSGTPEHARGTAASDSGPDHAGGGADAESGPATGEASPAPPPGVGPAAVQAAAGPLGGASPQAAGAAASAAWSPDPDEEGAWFDGDGDGGDGGGPEPDDAAAFLDMDDFEEPATSSAANQPSSSSVTPTDPPAAAIAAAFAGSAAIAATTQVRKAPWRLGQGTCS